MDSFYNMVRRHWPSAMVAVSFILPWTLTSPTSIPLVNLFTVWGQHTQYAFFVLPLLLFVPLLHALLALMEPRGLWRSLLTWTASLLIVCYSGLFVIIVMVGGRNVYDGALPGPGYLLALTGCLAAMIWEPLMESRERRTERRVIPEEETE